ncbi:DNA polymerase Y family protein [Pseudomonas qingdaonensis]|uniref:DNA polymerase Y family protein n=2 Tax=Pseudomonas TaxID=286 RepID=A0ABX8DKK5_9PSED|nr:MULTISPECIES: DNA polymerase Y family protein [Pseudomonas]KIU48157.1 DNA repair nucleotidyltransferase [Pseudomonas putida]MBG8559412.1 DNA polymerase Y family protein [Pseudomonas qingdaonensis]QVL16729.1 DNA polymerase Y family protein [Pseudomonas qingdaonensis]
MLWACILLPQLALDSVLRGRDDPQAPLVLLSGPAQRRVLQAVNPAARALGLRAGQSLSTAQALASSFTCVEHDPAAVEQLQQLLAAWAYQFSSQVSLHYPRTVLLEVESSLGLFGPWPLFEARLRKELGELGLRHRIVLASNPVAARMLANAHDGLALNDAQATRAALAQMPVDRIGLPVEAATALSRMGLRDLGQVLGLPRDTLARRFAASVQVHLDRLLGLRPMALACYRPPDRFEARLELNFDVESHQALLFPLRRLIADLAAFLASRDGGVQRFTLHLEHARGVATPVVVGLLAAEREAGMLFELARGRLEQLSLPAPVRSVRLVADDLPAFVPQPGELFNARPQQQQGWEQLRERLRARLGDESVRAVQAFADHRPECAWQAAGGAPPLARAPGGPPRPGWLLAEPQALAPEGLRLLAGPERIESGWWDGGDVRRDYYLVETPAGQRGWAYRPLGEGGPLWLQGWFA